MAFNEEASGSNSERVELLELESEEDAEKKEKIDELHLAATEGDAVQLKELIFECVEMKNDVGDTPMISLLKECAYNCKLDVNVTVKRNEGDASPSEVSGPKATECASDNHCNKHWSFFQILKEKTDVDKKNEANLNAISFAAMCADKKRGYLNELIEEGCETKVCNLYQTIKTSDDTAFFDRFIQLISKPKIKEKFSSFMYADNKGKYTLLQALSKNGMPKSYNCLMEEIIYENPFLTPLESHNPIQLSCLFAKPQMLEYFLSPNSSGLPDKKSLETKNRRNLLHLCTKNSEDFMNSFKCLKILLDQKGKFGSVNDKDSRGRTPLHYALMNDNENCVIELLKNGAHLDVKDNCKQTPLMYMSKCTFKKYLDTMIEETKYKDEEERKRNKKEGSMKNRTEPGSREHHQHPHETRSLAFNLTPLFLNSKIPKSGKVKNDQTSRTNGRPQQPSGNDDRSGQTENNDGELVKKYRFSTELLSKIKEVPDLQELLQHPVLSIIIYFKWRQIRRYFWSHLFIYFFFCVYYTFYIVSSKDNPVERFSGKSKLLSALGYDRKSKPLLASITIFDMVTNIKLHYIIPLSAIILLFLFLEFLKIIQRKLTTNEEEDFCLTWKCIGSYFRDIDNIIRIIVIVLATIVMACQNACFTPYCPQIKAISILMTWIEFFLVLGKYPDLSFYVTIFRSAFLHLLKFIAIHSALLIGFALSFHTLFRSTSPENIFVKPYLAIFKTLLMLTSEFDASDIPFDDHAVLSRLIFIAYIFIATFVLFNLMIGIAFKEVNEMEQKPFLYECIAQIEIIKHYEDIRQNIIFRKMEKFCKAIRGKNPKVNGNEENKLKHGKKKQGHEFEITWHRKTKNFDYYLEFDSKSQEVIVVKNIINCFDKLPCSRISDQVTKQARKIVSKKFAKTEISKDNNLCSKLEALENKLDKLLNNNVQRRVRVTAK